MRKSKRTISSVTVISATARIKETRSAEVSEGTPNCSKPLIRDFISLSIFFSLLSFLFGNTLRLEVYTIICRMSTHKMKFVNIVQRADIFLCIIDRNIISEQQKRQTMREKVEMGNSCFASTLNKEQTQPCTRETLNHRGFMPPLYWQAAPSKCERKKRKHENLKRLNKTEKKQKKTKKNIE